MQVSKTRSGTGREAIDEDADHWKAALKVCPSDDCAN